MNDERSVYTFSEQQEALELVRMLQFWCRQVMDCMVRAQDGINTSNIAASDWHYVIRQLERGKQALSDALDRLDGYDN